MEEVDGFYSKKEYRFIIVFHVVVLFVLMQFSTYSCAPNCDMNDIWLLYVFPAVYFLNPILVAYLQQNKDPKWGNLLALNFFITIFVFLSMLFSIIEGARQYAANPTGENLVLRALFLPYFILPMVAFSIHLNMDRKMRKSGYG